MKQQNKKPLTLLGFDFGTKSIGVAVGQTITKTAKPLGVLKAKNLMPPWDQIAKIIENWRPDAIVVGVPISMGSEGQEIVTLATKFANQLNSRFRIPVHLIDEHLTTIEAKAQIFAENGYKALRKSKIDSVSAKLILEDWMKQS